ncbi:hypothetical protein BDZ89DRAFT_1074019 [Hymenopellis radicata]|nr:hypothetical protein BDZ89DRAFT_1074019 [Hymenopellis radicata]
MSRIPSLLFPVRVTRTLLHRNLAVSKKCGVHFSTISPSHLPYKSCLMPKDDISRIRNVLRSGSSSYHAVARKESLTRKIEYHDLSRQHLEIRVAKTRKEAQADASEFPRGMPMIYTDGSALDVGVGAASWSNTLPGSSTTDVVEVAEHLYLGRNNEHTVLEAELVGVLLALGMVKSVRRLVRAIILSDSQSAIMAIRNGEVKGGERCLVEEFYRQMNLLVRSRPSLRIVLQWIPAHEGVGGNARADKEAKSAAARLLHC